MNTRNCEITYVIKQRRDSENAEPSVQDHKTIQPTGNIRRVLGGRFQAMIMMQGAVAFSGKFIMPVLPEMSPGPYLQGTQFAGVLA